MRNKGVLSAVFLLSLIVLVAGLAGAQKKLTFYYLDHGSNGSPAFWPQYYRGIRDATEMLAPLGVEVKHLAAGELDFKTQEEMLRQAVAANPDGLVTSIRDPKSYEAILKPLIAKGVPIMAANIDDPRPVRERIPYLAYYGEDQKRAGAELAEAVIAQVKKTGAEKPQRALLASSGAVGDPGWQERLQSFAERLAREYGTTSEQITETDGSQMAAYLAKNPNVDVLCAHESWTWYRYLGQLKGMGKTPGKDILIACFDSSSGILPYLKDGEVVAAYDQQQYLQGFLPLFDLYLYMTKGTVHPVSVDTGMLIDRSNADSIQEGAWAGYR
jgi:simple sugar transport system substrate-binding protein